MTLSVPIFFEGDRPDSIIADIKDLVEGRSIPIKMSRATGGAIGRMIAIDVNPPFLADYFLVSRNATIDEVDEALDWVLSDEESARATSLLDQLQAIMPGAREMSPEELASEAALRDFLAQS